MRRSHPVNQYLLPSLPILTLSSQTILAQSFLPTGSMKEARYYHTANLLNNGTVLVTGGYVTAEASPCSNTAEIYNPTTGTWRYTASTMNFRRAFHMAVKLQNGRVLIFGGFLRSDTGVSGVMTSELFDPVTETFTLTGPLNYPHWQQPAVLLNDGRVMLVGGLGQSPSEIYNPVSGLWTANVPALPTGEYLPFVSLLPTGEVFVAGGQDGYTFLSTAATYSPLNNSVRNLATLLVTRNNGTATTLPNGKVLLVGGVDDADPTNSLATVELYDPTVLPNGRSQLVAPLSHDRYIHTATPLPNGDVLIVGGLNTGNSFLASAELWSYQMSKWSSAGTMATPRYAFTATLLPSGQVLVAGGAIAMGDVLTTTAELWMPPPITVSTNLAAATFTITGPATYSGSGTYFSVMTAPAGVYTITYGAVPGYITPPPETKTLQNPSTISFSGIYGIRPVDSTTGTTPVTVSFSSVAKDGTTTLVTSSSDPPPPAGFQLGTPATYYNLTTTAVFSGPIVVCINYSGQGFSDPSTIQLFHYENGSWVDVTTSVNTAMTTVCGSVNSLSPFAVFQSSYKAIIQPPINADGSSVFKANRGVVPVKFILTNNGVATCQLPSAKILLARTAGGTVGPVNENDFLVPSDQGSAFRIDSCQYVYNLGTGSLGTGTYKVQIQIGPVVVGSASFGLQ
jgi:hypothetical protein